MLSGTRNEAGKYINKTVHSNKSDLDRAPSAPWKEQVSTPAPRSDLENPPSLNPTPTN